MAALPTLYSVTLPLPTIPALQAKPLGDFDDAHLEIWLRQALMARGTFSEENLRGLYYNPAMDGQKLLLPREEELYQLHPRFPIFAPVGLLPQWVLNIIADRAHFDRALYKSRLRLQKCRQKKMSFTPVPATELAVVSLFADPNARAARAIVGQLDDQTATSDATKENHSSASSGSLSRMKKPLLVEQRQLAAAANHYDSRRSELTQTNIVNGEHSQRSRKRLCA